MLISTDLLTLFSLTPKEGIESPEISSAWADSSLVFLANIHQPRSDALKDIIEENGWPLDEDYTDHAQAAAFMITLHADYDVPFQKHCHNLMLEQATLGNTPLGFIAFLTDRILCNDNNYQRFGTQIREADNGCFVPKAIENSDLVDELREQAGLGETLGDYYQRVNAGDMLLPRLLLGEYADIWDPPQRVEAAPKSDVVDFPTDS